MKSASEYWKERFGEEPKSDNDKLMCAMMREYAEHYQEEMQQALSLGAVVGQSEQLKAFANYAQNRMWEDADKDLYEFVDEFLSL